MREPSRDSILKFCRALGWGLALAVVGASGVAELTVKRAANDAVERGVTEKQMFLSKIRACIHDPQHPRPWPVCEQEVRAAQ